MTERAEPMTAEEASARESLAKWPDGVTYQEADGTWWDVERDNPRRPSKAMAWFKERWRREEAAETPEEAADRRARIAKLRERMGRANGG